MSQQATYEEPTEFEPREYTEACTIPIAYTVTELADSRTVVVKIYPDALINFGTRIKLEIPALAGDLDVGAMYIGLAVAEGSAWEFETATQINYEGNAAFTVPDGTVITTDEVDFEFDGSRAILIAAEFAAGARLPYAPDFEGVATFYKDGVLSAASLSKGAGYTPQDRVAFCASRILVAP